MAVIFLNIFFLNTCAWVCLVKSRFAYEMSFSFVINFVQGWEFRNPRPASNHAKWPVNVVLIKKKPPFVWWEHIKINQRISWSSSHDCTSWLPPFQTWIAHFWSNCFFKSRPCLVARLPVALKFQKIIWKKRERNGACENYPEMRNGSVA